MVQKSIQNWSSLPEGSRSLFLTILGGFWPPLGRPLGLIFGTLGVILEVQKKSRKKDANKFVKMVEGGRFCGMRGSPGEDLEGSKLSRRCRAESAKQKKKEISESS